MTNKEKYREFLQQLQQIYNPNEAAVITERVFEKVADLQHSDIIKNPGQIINPEILARLNECLVALLQHKPMQYVVGEAWFYRMKLIVNENVLIPRPETEELIQLLIEDLKKAAGQKDLSALGHFSDTGSGLSILDIGTGSGCIAVSVKKSLPDIKMFAIDVSPDALAVATQNAANQMVDIRYMQVDFLNENRWEELPVFDIIISNPPYIPLKEMDILDKNVTAFEPHIALFVPDNQPLIFYEKIAAFGKKHLSANGKIYVEIHEDFAKDTVYVFKQSYSVSIKKDLFGKERMLVATIGIPW